MNALAAATSGLAGGTIIVLKTTLLFVAAGGIVAALVRSSAALRHHVIAAAFAAALALPGLTLVLPAWRVVPGPPAAAGPGWRATVAPAATHGPGRPAPPNPPSDAVALAVTEGPAATGGTRAGESPAARLPVRWSLALVGVWSAGTAALLLLLGLRVAAIGRVVRRSIPVRGAEGATIARQLGAGLGIDRPVALRRSATGTMPLVWGLRRPVILLPCNSVSWTASRLRAVVSHELAHVARRDVATLLLGHVVCAVYWFNPFVWWLARRAAMERERACDDVVLELGAQPVQYAEHILELAAAHGTAPALAPVMAARSQLEGRIMAILNPQLNRRSVRSAAFATVALSFVVLIPLSSAAMVTEPRSTRPASQDAAPVVSDSERFRAHLASLDTDRRDVSALIAGLASDAILTRGASAWALGHTGDARAIDPLIGALDDGEPMVREWAARSLGRFRAPRIVPPLVSRLDDPSAVVREWAARSLADIGDTRAVQPLIDRLDDESATVREWIVRALGELGDARAVEPLLRRADDPSASVREWSIRAIRMIRGDRRSGRPVEASSRTEDGRDGDDRQDAASVDRLVEQLSDPSPAVRAQAARALGDFGHRYRSVRPAVEPLIPGPDDGDRTLLRREDPRAVEPLIRALNDQYPSVREWSARSLGSFADPRSVEPLVQRLTDTSVGVRAWAARSLGAIGDARAVPPLIGLIGEQRGETHEWFLRALGSMPDRRAAPAFLDALESDSPTIREWAIRGLGVLRDPAAFDPLVARLGDHSAAVREWATRALGALEDRRAVAPLERMLDDDSADVRRWAARALRHLGG